MVGLEAFVEMAVRMRVFWIQRVSLTTGVTWIVLVAQTSEATETENRTQCKGVAEQPLRIVTSGSTVPDFEID